MFDPVGMSGFARDLPSVLARSLARLLPRLFPGVLPCALSLIGRLGSCSSVGWTGYDEAIAVCLLPARLQGYRIGCSVAGLVASKDVSLLADWSLIACRLGLSLASVAGRLFLESFRCVLFYRGAGGSLATHFLVASFVGCARMKLAYVAVEGTCFAVGIGLMGFLIRL